MSYIKSNLKYKNTFSLMDCLFRELELDNVISGTNQPLTVVKKKIVESPLQKYLILTKNVNKNTLSQGCFQSSLK